MILRLCMKLENDGRISQMIKVYLLYGKYYDDRYLEYRRIGFI